MDYLLKDPTQPQFFADCGKSGVREVIYQRDGASRLLSLLLEADEITFIGGRAINPAHQNPKLSGELS